MTERLILEFTVEPFVDDALGPHVEAAIEAARAASDATVAVDVGPFGTTVRGPRDAVLATSDAAVRAAMSNGATRVSLQITTEAGHAETTEQ